VATPAMLTTADVPRPPLRAAVTTVIAFGLLAAPAGAAQGAGRCPGAMDIPATPEQMTVAAGAVVCLVNAERATRGIPALRRDADLAQRHVASLAPAELAKTLAVAGFSGIYVDRYGYEDHASALETELSNVLQTTPSISANGRLVFFNLVDFGRRLRQTNSSSEWERERELSFQPVLLEWRGGFSELESRPDKTWRWCSSEGQLHLRNTSQLPRTVRFDMSFASGYAQLDDFIISGLFSEQFKVNDKPYVYSKTVTLPRASRSSPFAASRRG